jgi:hypothetical protein
MDVNEDSEKISIKYIPISKWISGGILTFILGVFGVWFIYFMYANPNNSVNWLSLFLVTAFALAIIFPGIFDFNIDSLIFAPLITVKLNQNAQNVDIIRLRFYGKRTERFYFHQIRKFKSYKAKLNFSSQYFLALVLVNGKMLKLRIPIGDDKQNTVKFVKKLNKFIRKKVESAPIVSIRQNKYDLETR